jgi:cation transport ATPase
VSDEVPAREEIVRSTIVSMILASVFIILSVLFWVWDSLPEDTPLTALKNINPFIPIGLEVLFMFGMFIFLSVTVINLRHYLTRIRSGWLDIIILMIIATVISYAMFGEGVAAASFLIDLGFVAYLYLLQE